MNLHLGCALVVFVLVSSLLPLRAEPPENPEGAKKLDVKPPLPPFPSGGPGDPLLPPPKKSPSTEPPVLPLPKVNSPNEPAPVPTLSKETNHTFDIIMVAPVEGGRSAFDQVGIGFFNHSERDLLLEINNRTVKLGSHYYVQIKLPREFSWREKEGPIQKTKVPPEADGAEIVFRR